MLDDLWNGILIFSSMKVLLAMAAAVPLGLVFGTMPGIGGLVALAIVLPMIYGMEPAVGLAFLLSCHAMIATSGAVPAILLGIPPSVGASATVIDGYTLARRGRAGYAMGAALGSSALGGLIGAVVLIVLLPIIQPVVMSFGSPETFFLALLGLSYLALMGGSSPIKGLAAAGLGLFMGTFGYHSLSGIPRFWMDFDYLLDGFRIIPLALGLFAIPEIVELMSGRSIAAKNPDGSNITMTFKQVWLGVMANFVRLPVLIRSSLMGTFIGMVPGVGSETAPFITYGTAKQTSKRKHLFGKGSIEGVIGPEGANNAKEGGSLVPTLAFGVPGSSAMVLLLGGFLMLGLQPGPEFLKNHMDMAYGLAFVLIAANFVGAMVLILLAKHLAKITLIPGHVLMPILVSLVVLGAYASESHFEDVLFVFIFGVLGVIMKRYGYARPALLLGFVLAPLLENYLVISLSTYGPTFFMRPISLAIVGLILIGGLLPLLRYIRKRRNSDADMVQEGLK